MRRLRSLFLLLFAPLALTFTACSGKDEVPVRLVPKTASMVVTIDMESMSIKSLDFKSVFKMLGEEGAESEMDKNANALMESGLDITASGYLFADFSKEDIPYSAGVFPILDAEKFKAYAQEQYKDLTWTESEGAQVGQNDKGLTVAIKGKRVLMLNVYKSPAKETVLSKVEELFGLPETETLTSSDARFAAQQEGDSYDIALWANLEEISKWERIEGMIDAASVKGVFETAEIEFGDGSIRLTSRTHLSEPLSKEKKGLVRSGISPALAAAVPSDETPVAVLGLALQPNSLLSMFGQKGGPLEDVLFAIEVSTGLDTKELAKLLTGDVVFSMSDFKVRESMTPFSEKPAQVPDPQVAVCLGVADKGLLGKLETGISELPGIEKVQDYYVMADQSGGKAFFYPRGDNFLLLSGEDLLNQVSNRQTKALPKVRQDVLTGHTFSLFVDKTALDINAFSMIAPEGERAKLVALWPKIPFTTLQITSKLANDQEILTVVEVSLGDKERNSLQVLADFARELEKSL